MNHRGPWMPLLVACLGGMVLWMGWFLPVTPLLNPEQMQTYLTALFTAILAVGALWGSGRALLGLCIRTIGLEPMSGRDRWIRELGFGLACWTPLLWFLAEWNALSPWILTPLALVSIVGILSFPDPLSTERPRTQWEVALYVAVFFALAVVGIEALAPPTDTDELYVQLATAREILFRGDLPGGWLNPVASRPLPLQLLFAALLAVGGEQAPRLFHLLCTALLLLGLLDTVRAHQRPAGGFGGAWAAALLLGSWTLLDEAPLAHDNISTAFLVLAALSAALNRQVVLFGWIAGGALAVKYTAAPALLGIGVLILAQTLEQRRTNPLSSHLPLFGLAALSAALLIAPWWIRNAVDGMHPLFPYLGWPNDGTFVYAYPEKYGVGRSLTDLIRLPWDLIFRAETHSFVFLGRIHPLWLFFLPIALFISARDRTVRWLMLGTVSALIVWFALGAQWMRHLIPIAPVCAVAYGLSGAHLAPFLQRILAGIWLLLLPTQCLDAFTRATHALPVVLGQQTRSTYLEQELSSWGSIEFINTHLPTNALLAGLFTSERYLVRPEMILGSVEDHTPTRYFLRQHQEESLQELANLGVTHIWTRNTHFLRKSYPFLSEAEFNHQFSSLEEQLESALVHQATLIYQDNRYAVWKLDLDAEQSGR